MTTLAIPRPIDWTPPFVGTLIGAVVLAMGLLVSRVSVDEGPDETYWDGLLDPARAKDWHLVGIDGGVPARTTQCGSTLTDGASTATIQSTMNACTEGQVVVFGAGTFTLTASIFANKGIVLRGQGADSTTIVLGAGDNIYFGTNGTGGLGSDPGTTGSTNWTGGLTRGSTVLTVVSTTGMAAGRTVLLDELNRAWIDVDNGDAGPCAPSNDCGRNGTDWYNGDTRAMHQAVTIVSVDSSTQITVTPPVAYTHVAGSDPEVFFWSDGGGDGSIEYAGIEDMRIDASDEDFAVAFHSCDRCWVKGVWIENLARSAIVYWWSYNGVVRDSYFESDAGGGPTQYGIECYNGGNILVENNIFYRVTAPELHSSCHGNVSGYNYALNSVSGNQFAAYNTHAAHNSFHLIEGNVVGTIKLDSIWGSGSHATVFRNRASGNEPNKTNYTVPLVISSFNLYTNVVGNVLGDTAQHTNYACDAAHDLGTSDDHVYDLGYNDECGTADPVHDVDTEQTLMRWGNWDAVNEAILYCTAASTPIAACTANERGDGAATFPALASPITSDWPASFYLSAKPAWFGSVIWPPIGPDVSCVSNCISDVGGFAAKIPAQLCYEATAKDGSGFLTTFDPEACY